MITIKRIVILLSLLIPSLAYGYTYQDVEDWLTANPAPEGCSHRVERFDDTSGRYGYKIWKRCGNKDYKREGYLYAWSSYPGYPDRWIQKCDGTPDEELGGGFLYNYGSWKFIKITDCNGVERDGGAKLFASWRQGKSNPCHIESTILFDCSKLDTLVATFFPIDECDIEVSKPTSSITVIDPNTGGSVVIKATITSSTPVKWEMFVSGRKISEGSGLSVSGIWDGKLSDGRVADPGSYEVTVTATSTTTQNCSKTNTATIKVTRREEDCKLEVTVGSSANIASGNLYHSQTLFQIPNSKIISDFTLSYNSLDTYTGPLGLGWTHSYNIRLYPINDGRYFIMEGDGGRITLSDNGSGRYTPENAPYPVLDINTDGTYMLTKKDGTKYYFDTGGKLTKIEDRLANIMTFTYTGNNLTETTDSVGRKNTLFYDSNNRLTQLITHNSQLTTFSYNSSGYLTAVTDSSGYSWTYTYDATGRMLAKSDTEGNLVTYTYNSNSRVISSVDASGQSKTISYDSANQKATVTERDGGVWSYTYDASNGTLTQKTDPQGNTTTYQYDSNKNLIKETSQDGSTTTYTYDIQGNMTTQTDASGNTTTYTYNDYGQVTSIKDPQSNVTYYSYDTYGNLTSVTDLSGGITQFNYDSKGNIIRITSPNGGVTVYEYDQYNNLTKTTDPNGNTTTFTYDSAGNMTSMTDSQGNTTRFEYNTLNQLIRVIDSNGNVTEYSYDSRGNKTSQTDANGNITYYTYNYKGQLTRVIDALGNVTTYTYGGTGGCPSCGSGGGDNLTTITDAKGQITTYEYDTLGRLTKETDPLGNSITYSYDSKGNLVSKVDANGATINYTYDALGRLTKKTYPDSTTESFTYDSKGNILTASNKNISYTFTYDASGKVANVTNSYGRTIKYQYDVSGNKTQMTTPEEKIIKYNYDVSHRLTQISTDVEQTSTPTFTFTYDSSGRRTKLTYPNGVTTNYTYDSIGRLTNLLTQYTELQSQGKKKPPILKLHAINSFTYTHDKVGNRLTKTEISSPSPLAGEGGVRGNKYDYSYDTIYRLLQSLPTKLNDKDKEEENRAELFTYDPVGNRLTGPKEKLNYTYNVGNQLTELIKEKKDDEERKTEYQYDRNGNLIKKVELDDEGQIKRTTLYTYNYENRLTKVEIQKGDKLKIVTFTYDPFGRRLSKSVSHLSLRGEAEAIPEEDDNDEGDDERDDDRDDDDRITPRATYYVYDNEDIILEYNHKGKVTARYVHGLGIDEPLAIEQKGKVYYYHFDGLGSVTALTDAKGKVVQRYEYDSFGKLKRQGNKVKNAFTYTAREYDRETGLYYYRARYYDAKIGRFTSFDPILKGWSHTEPTACSESILGFPIHNPQELNPYIYVVNNPLALTDPSGEAPWYGNYCGPGNNPGPPIDKLDASCQSHDNCYAAAGLSWWNVPVPPKDPNRLCAQDECDDKLCSDAKNFIVRTITQRIARRTIISIFCD